MHRSLVFFALLLAFACTVPTFGPAARVARFDFETDRVGVAPGGLQAPKRGWIARIEPGGAPTGGQCVRILRTDVSESLPAGEALSQTVDARAYRGKIVRLRASVRVDPTAGPDSYAALWVRVTRENGARGLEDRMEDAPILDTQWIEAEIVGAVSADAETLSFGVLVAGKGPFFVDDLAVEVLRDVGEGDPPQLERISRRQLAMSDVQTVHLRSEHLSRFWGRDIFMDAAVVMPPDPKPGETFPSCYEIPDLEGSYLDAYTTGVRLMKTMRTTTYPRMMYVFLEGMTSLGHHEFADSVNTGPWATALVSELIPAIEKRFLGGRAPKSRFLTGHASGGWSALWLQVNYPHLFDGTWATAPLPVDFRDFSGVDIYSAKSLYFNARGRELPFVRAGELPAQTFRSYVLEEAETHPYGGRMDSFDAVFSPRGDDGRPMPLFDRESGDIDPYVAESWRKYDISAILHERWDVLGLKLRGKIHVWCGELDTYRYEGAIKLLKANLDELGSDVDVRIVAGRKHTDLAAPLEDLWPNGMKTRIHREMWARTSAIVRP